MARRVFILALILFTSPCFSAVPALVFASSGLAPLVVRSVGRAQLLHLGIAANDASFATALGGWSAANVAIGTVKAALGYNYLTETDQSVEIQIAPDEPLTYGPPITGYYWRVTNPFYADGYADSKQAAVDAAALAIRVKQSYAECTGYLESNPPGYTSYQNWASCRKTGQPEVFVHYVEIQSSASGPITGEQRDNVKRVIRDGQFWKQDPTDPDWWPEKYVWTNNNPGTFDSGQIQISMPSSSEAEDAEDLIVDIAGHDNKVVLRAVDYLTREVSALKQFITNANKVPVTFTHNNANPGTPSVQQNVSLQLHPNASSTTGNNPVVNVQFPSDYARDASVTATTAKLTNSENVADTTPPEKMTFFDDTFDSLRGWRLPSHASQCPRGSFSWNGATYVIDMHCQLINDHWGVLQSVMFAVWIVLALFIVLGA